MQLSGIPAKIPVPFADSGTKNTIPTAASPTPGLASFTLGFPPITMTPIAAGGIPPQGGDFNGVLNAITQAVRWAMAGGTYQYDSAFSTAVGGYPKGGVLANLANTGLWMSTADNNTTNPDTGGAGWTSITAGRFLGVQVITASGTYTPGVYGGVTATKAIVEAVGGGGGGGGVPATAASQVAIGGSGSAGGYGKIFISSGLTSQTVTIGAAGAAGSAGVNAGGSGGATLFAGLLVCNGGGGGGSANAAAGPTFAFPVGGGSVSGTGVFLSKMVGQIAQVGISINNTLVTSGSGGNSPLGTGGSQAAGAAGAPATAGGFGGGGSGAGLVQGQSASAGGSGTPGVIIVYEYA